MSQQQKYFRILGINPTTDKGAIKKAYRKLAFKYHPDVNDSPEAQSKFIELSDAYDVLMGVKKAPKSRKPKSNSAQSTTAKDNNVSREERVKAAKDRYEKAKHRELEEEANYYFKLISGWKWRFMKLFGMVSSVFALLLILDFILPTQNELFVVENTTTNDLYGQVFFEIDNNVHYFDYLKASLIQRYPLIEIHFTPLFNDFKSFSFVGGPEASQYVKPMFCYLYFFPIVIVLLLLPLLTVWYKRPTPLFSIMYKLSYYISPLLFLIICLSNWRIFQMFL